MTCIALGTGIRIQTVSTYDAFPPMFFAQLEAMLSFVFCKP